MLKKTKKRERIVNKKPKMNSDPTYKINTWKLKCILENFCYSLTWTIGRCFGPISKRVSQSVKWESDGKLVIQTMGCQKENVIAR